MYDVYGVACATYEEACIVAGVDTPDQIRAELEWEHLLWLGGKRPEGPCCHKHTDYEGEIPW